MLVGFGVQSFNLFGKEVFRFRTSSCGIRIVRMIRFTSVNRGWFKVGV